MIGNNLNTMDKEAYAKYERAKKSMNALKGFYSHVWIFTIVTIMIFAVRFYLLPMLGVISEDEGFINWLNVNTYIVPGIWGLVILVHGLSVHNLGIQWIRNWETRKIQEFIEEEDLSSNSDNTNN